MSNRTRPQRIEWQKSLIECQAWTSCLNCDNWNTLITTDGTTREERIGCSLADHTVPPPEIIVHGCQSWIAECPF